MVSTYLTDAGEVLLASLLASLNAPVSAEHARQLEHMSEDQTRALIALTTLPREVA